MAGAYMKALQEKGMAPMENPANSNKSGDVIYISKSLFPGKCKEGDKYTVHMTVDSVGSKIGLTPDRILHNNAEDGGEENGQSETEEGSEDSEY